MRRSSRHYLLAGGVVLLAGGVVAAALRRWPPLGRVEVRGESMRPALEPGDRLVVLRRGRPVRAGDVVAVGDPRMPARTLLKRVATRGPEGLTVLGDNPGASTDSRSLGPLSPAAVRGRAVYRYVPAARRGLL